MKQKLNNIWINTLVLFVAITTLVFCWLEIFNLQFFSILGTGYEKKWIYGFIVIFSLTYYVCLKLFRDKTFKWYHYILFFTTWFFIFIFFAGLFWSYIDNVQNIYNPTFTNMVLKIMEEICRIFELGVYLLFTNIPLNILILIIPFFLLKSYFKK